MSQLKKSWKIYTALDVSKHNSKSSLWIIRDGKIYDVTSFAPDHPGGDELISRFAGQDIDKAMEDPSEHVHSDSAYELLSEYQIGRLGTEESIVKDDIVIDDDFEPEETDTSSDFQKNQFLDLKKPLIAQVWFSNFSKDFYLNQVHQPRHLPESAQLFGPWYLECFTKTPWYIVPMFWLPISANLFMKCMSQHVAADPSVTYDTAFRWAVGLFLVGNFLWTIIEYGMHRFLFHIDDWLPDHRIALTLHFLAHGIHHALPMDRLRLVMPPILFATLQHPFTTLGYAIFPRWCANGIISGAFAFYVIYDTMHYALHHSKLPTYLKKMKVFHLEHHFRNYEAGFGVTSPIWDWVFKTDFDEMTKKRLAAQVAATSPLR